MGGDVDAYVIGIGWHIFDHFSFMANYAKVDPEDDDDIDLYSLSVEYLWLFANGNAFKTEVGYSFEDLDETDNLDNYSLSGTYYINRNIGLGARYSSSKTSNNKVDNWGILAEWFVNEKTVFSERYSDTSSNDSDAESDTIVVTVLMRF